MPEGTVAITISEAVEQLMAIGLRLSLHPRRENKLAAEKIEHLIVELLAIDNGEWGAIAGEQNA